MTTSGSIDRVGEGRRVAALTGVTNASGNVTFTFTPAFAGVPVVAFSVVAPISNVLWDWTITAISAGSVTLNVQQSIPVTLLAVNVYALKTAANGVTMHCLATEAGQGV